MLLIFIIFTRRECAKKQILCVDDNEGTIIELQKLFEYNLTEIAYIIVIRVESILCNSRLIYKIGTFNEFYD